MNRAEARKRWPHMDWSDAALRRSGMAQCGQCHNLIRGRCCVADKRSLEPDRWHWCDAYEKRPGV